MKGKSSNKHQMGQWYTVKTKQTLRRRSVDCYFEGRDLTKIPKGLEGGKDWPYAFDPSTGKPILDNPPYIRVTGTRIWYPKSLDNFKQGMMIGYRYIKQGFIYEAIYGYESYGPGEVDIFDIEEYERVPCVDVRWFNNNICGTAPRLHTTTLTKVCLIVFNASQNPVYVLPEDVAELAEAVE